MNRLGKRVKVLARPAYSNRRANPYNHLIYSQIGTEVEVEEFTLWRALTRRYDVVHVHWPESTFNHSLIEALLTTSALLWSLRLQKRRGAKLLWTVHNLRAHEKKFPHYEERFWTKWLQLIDGFITLQNSALPAIEERFPPLKTLASWCVPHPDYRGVYPDKISRDAARISLGLPASAKVLLFFGRVFDYKNLPSLLEAFYGLKDETHEYRLLIAGSARNEQIKENILGACAKDARIISCLEFIPEEEAQIYFRAANLVVLPYREILNSGSALLALSFDRPVLLPSSHCSDELASSVSTQWVHAYQQLNAQALKAALQATAELPERTEGAHLASYDSQTIAGQMRTTFQALADKGNA